LPVSSRLIQMLVGRKTNISILILFSIFPLYVKGIVLCVRRAFRDATLPWQPAVVWSSHVPLYFRGTHSTFLRVRAGSGFVPPDRSGDYLPDNSKLKAHTPLTQTVSLVEKSVRCSITRTSIRYWGAVKWLESEIEMSRLNP
jgi:hypothetical protein